MLLTQSLLQVRFHHIDSDSYKQMPSQIIVIVHIYQAIYNLINQVRCLFMSQDIGDTTKTQIALKQQLKKLEDEIAHYTQKHQVQAKRLKYLKKQNEELKIKKVQTFQVSDQIKEQNKTFKQENKQLKEKLKQLKDMANISSSYSGFVGPRSTTLRDIVINSLTEQVDLPKSEINDQDVDSIKTFTNIKTLIMGQNGITDLGLEVIANNLINLRKLFLNHNQITDQGLRNIQKLKQMRWLDLRCNKITDLGLKYVGQLTSLSQLSISNNEISDQGVPFLQNLKSLKYLDITSNKIGQNGGMVLSKLKQLSNLYLSHNKVSGRCVRQYFKKLKQLKVLDVRFNQIDKEMKQELRSQKPQDFQLFV